MPSRSAIDFVTSGSYQRELIEQVGQTWVAGTEHECTEFAANIVAISGSGDRLYSWIRWNMFVYSSAETLVFEWMLFRNSPVGGAFPDMNDAAEIEKLQKEKKILRRGIMYQPQYGNGSVKLLRDELYNVALKDDEELVFLVRPFYASGANAVSYVGVLEYRLIGE